MTATVPSSWPDCGPARPAFQEVGGRGWTQSQPIQQRKQWSKCLVCWEWLLCHIKHATNDFIYQPVAVTAMHISLFLQLTHHPFQSRPSTPTLWAARTGALHLAGYQTWNWMLPKQHLVFGSIHKFHKLEDPLNPLSLFVMKSLDASGGALAGKASRGLDNQSLFPTIPSPKTVREGGRWKSRKTKKRVPQLKIKKSIVGLGLVHPSALDRKKSLLRIHFGIKLVCW